MVSITGNEGKMKNLGVLLVFGILFLCVGGYLVLLENDWVFGSISLGVGLFLVVIVGWEYKRTFS